MRRIAWLLALVACARPERKPARRASDIAVAPQAEQVDEESVSRVVDPHTLPELGRASGKVGFELYAQDVYLDWLLLHVADGPFVSRASSENDDSVTGRLTASSRAAALKALVDAHPLNAMNLATNVKGTGRRVDLALARMPAQELALLLAELLDIDIVAALPDWPVTVVAHDTPADALLFGLAAATGTSIRKAAKLWVLERPDRIIRHRFRGNQRVDLWLDRVEGAAAFDLIRAASAVPEWLTCPGTTPISARVRGAPLGDVLNALFAPDPRWEDGNTPISCGSTEPKLQVPGEGTLVLGLARGRNGAAALLAMHPSHYPRWLVRANAGKERVIVGPTSVSIRIREQEWEGAIATPSLPAEVPGTRDFTDPDRWRLAATLREGSLWRALLVSKVGAVWVSSAETDRVVSIEAGRVQLVPDDPDGPPITILMRRL
jgi:hypothetical protein